MSTRPPPILPCARIVPLKHYVIVLERKRRKEAVKNVVKLIILSAAERGDTR